MAYTALYRKLRPSNFHDIIGQEHIVRTLQNQILNDRISHAYLFCGTRGTGKTSTSLVFSKAINCLDLQGGEPCNKCTSCDQINRGRSMDVMEIDAASNNGVDNIRDIREEVNYPPTVGAYKIYIIDEVHMLSTGAFNALLKTLEEPPAHVIFILATTDPQKLPATILSRCQRYDFRRITADDMAKTIWDFVEEENKKIDIEAIRYICSVSDGAMRDALSILDQAMAFYFDEQITVAKVLELVGSVDKTVFFDLTQALIKFDGKSAIDIIDVVINNGRDISQFTADIVKHLRDLLVATSVSNHSNALNYSVEHIKKLREQGEKCDKSYLIKMIGIFSKLQLDLKTSNNQRILLETACIKLCNCEKENDIEGLLLRISKLEKSMENGALPVAAPTEIIKEEKKVVKLEKAMPNDIKNIIDSWNIVLEKIEKPSDRAMLGTVTPSYIEGETLYLVSQASTDFFIKRLTAVENALAEIYEKKFDVEFITEESYNINHVKKFGVEDDKLVKKKTEQVLNNLRSFNVDINTENF